MNNLIISSMGIGRRTWLGKSMFSYLNHFTVPYSEIASIYSASYEPVRPVKSGQTNGTGQKPDKTKKPEKKSDKKSEAPKQDQKPRSVEEAAKLVN